MTRKESSIEKNYVYNVIYKVLIVIAPLITTPYVARKLGVSAIGQYSYVLTIVNMIILIGTLGTGLYAQKGIAQRRDFQKEKNIFFQEIFYFRLIGLGIASVIYFLVMFVDKSNTELYFVCGIEIIAALCDISWLYQGEEDFEKIVLRNVILKILTIISIFLLIKNENDLLVYAGIRAGSLIAANIVMWHFKEGYVQYCPIQIHFIQRHFKGVFTLFIPQISIQFYSNSDKLMLQWISGNFIENGYYDQANKIIELCNIFASALNATMLPRLTYLLAHEEKDTYFFLLKRSIQYVLLISLPMGIGLFCISNNFAVCFLGPGFEAVGTLLKVYSPFLIISGLNGVICQQYLVASGKEKIYMKLTILASAVNIISNIFLIPIFGAVGAVGGTLISEALILGIILRSIVCCKVLSIFELLNLSKKYLLSSIIMGFVIYAVSKLEYKSKSILLMQISIGILIYFGSLFVLKDELVENFYQKHKESRDE